MEFALPRPFRFLIIAALLVAVALVGLTLARPAATQTTSRLQFAPADLTLNSGDSAVIDLRLSGAQDLASYEMDLSFDPAVVAVERVERVVGTDAQPSNRTWLSLPATGDPDVTFLQPQPGAVSFGAYSFGAANPPGLSGDVTLAHVRLRGVQGGTTTLHVTRVLTTDSRAQPSQPAADEGRVTVNGLYRLFLPLSYVAWPLTPRP